MSKVVPILVKGRPPSWVACPRCERTLKLHAQTINQLAQTETQLVSALARIRELEMRLRQEGEQL